MKKIGQFKGKEISEMTREELLDFSSYAANEIQRLYALTDKFVILDLHREAFPLKADYKNNVKI